MWLLKEIISSYETNDEYNYLFSPDSHFRTKLPRGIPIGNLTSQLFANLYLNELDQYLKHQLGIHPVKSRNAGILPKAELFNRVKNYVRYVDDFVILANNKIFLKQLVEKIKVFLYDNLYLTLHPKKVSIFPTNLGIDFLGYVIFKDHILLRAQNVKKFRKRLKRFQKIVETAEGSLLQAHKRLPSVEPSAKKDKEKKEEKIQESITAWLAHAQQADTYQLRKAIFRKPLTAKNQKEIKEFVLSWNNIKPSEKPSHKPFCQLRLF